MKRPPISLFAFLGASLLPAFQTSAEPTQNLGDMIVTGTRTTVDRDHLPDSVIVFTREDIERLQVSDLPELLKGQAGLDLTNNGGYGKATSLFIRGTNSDHVLVLIDGIKVGSATLGTPSLQHYPIDQIERVEIVKGPHSSLYGSEAIGGVIQIFTRKGISESPRYTLRIGGGSESTYDLSGAVSGVTGNTSYSLGVSHFNTGGIDARTPTSGFFAVNEPDDDGYHNTSVSFQIGKQFSDRLRAKVFALRAQGNTEFDSSDPGSNSDFMNQVVGASITVSPARFWESSLKIGESRDESESFNHTGSPSNIFDTKRFDLNWQNTFTINPLHSLVAGFDYRNDQVSGTTAYDENSRNNKGIYAQYLGNFDKFDIVASFRHDDNEAFGSQQTGSAGFSLGRFGGIRLTGSFGTAFKGPSFNELYFPNFGNPDLKPESSRSWELGMDGDYSWGSWSARIYRTSIDDLIVFKFNPVTFEFKPINVDEALIKGAELEFGTEVAGWAVNTALALISPKDRATGNQLPRRARRSLRLDLSRDFDRFNFGATIVAYDHRFDDTANTTRVAGYATVDLRGTYTVDDHWSISGHINNLLNKRYQTVNTYNQDGINAMVYVRYQSK